MQFLKQSTAATIKLGPFLDSTDGDTEEGGLTIAQADVRLSKNGGNYAQKNEASGATYDETGEYDVALDATDTGTVGRLRAAVHVAGALAVWRDFFVLPANVYDALAGTDKLQVDARELNGGDLAGANAIINLKKVVVDNSGGSGAAFTIKSASGDIAADFQGIGYGATSLRLYKDSGGESAFYATVNAADAQAMRLRNAHASGTGLLIEGNPDIDAMLATELTGFPAGFNNFIDILTSAASSDSE